MKLAMGKRNTVAVVCVLVAAAVIAALFFGANAGTMRQGETAAGSTVPPSSTPLDTGNGEPDNTGTGQTPEPTGAKKVLNVYSYDDELELIINEYIRRNPGFDYEVRLFYTPLVDYYHTLSLINQNLPGDAEAVADIYCVPVAYASHFTKGEMSRYACTYKELGIDVEAALKKADIPQYVIDAGTNPDGELIALPYKPYVNVFMYRRSIAREVWGTDDPERISEIIGGGTESWDKFLQAAQTLKKHGYYIVPGCHDLSLMIDTSIQAFSSDSDAVTWINPDWEDFMKISKAFYDQGFIGDILPYGEEWSMALNGKGDKPAFGFFIMLDFINNTALDYYLRDTAGDWAICLPPFKTADGNVSAGVMVNRNSPHKEALGPLIEWITLDCSETGLQYLRATDTLYRQDAVEYHLYELAGGKKPVVSGTVLHNTSTDIAFLGGQNINPVVNGSQRTPSRVNHSYSSPQSGFFLAWFEETQAYIKGEKSKDAAVADYLRRAEELAAGYKETFEEYGMSHLLP